MFTRVAEPYCVERLRRTAIGGRFAGGTITLLATVALIPFLLAAQTPDRVSEMVETMRRMAYEGDMTGAGQLLPELVAQLGTPHPKAPLAWNQIGVYYMTQGNFTEAERAYKRGIQLREMAGAEIDGGLLALLLLNLGEVYLQTGTRPGQAEVLLLRALRLATETYGPNSFKLANYVYLAGAARLQKGDHKGAEQYFEKALGLTDTTRDGKIRRGIILANIAVLRARNREWDPAQAAAREAIVLLEENMGSGHPDLVPCLINMAALHQRSQQWDLARADLERAQSIAESRLNPGHPYLSAILESRAFVLRKLGRRAEARELSQRAKAMAKAQPAAVGASTWVHLSDLKR